MLNSFLFWRPDAASLVLANQLPPSEVEAGFQPTRKTPLASAVVGTLGINRGHHVLRFWLLALKQSLLNHFRNVGGVSEATGQNRLRNRTTEGLPR